MTGTTDIGQALADASGTVPNRDEAPLKIAPARRPVRVTLSVPVSLVFALIGGGLLAQANGTIDAFFLTFLMLVTGSMITAILFPGKSPEFRAFLLSFSVCAFVGGVAQCYSLAVFGDMMSTNDANNFFDAIERRPPYYTLEELSTIWSGNGFLGYGAPLAIVVWQQVYHFLVGLGFQFGPYIGVLFNAFVVALSGCLTVLTARELFGNDPWRLRRVGTLFASCGMFVLFGAIMIRDCYTLFLNAAVLWGIVRWLVRPSARSLVLSIAVTVAASACMWYLRKNAIYLFGFFYAIAFFCWYWRGKITLGYVLVTFAIPAVLLLSSAILYQYYDATLGAILYTSEYYEGSSAQSSLEDSLGMALVINQPLPIRATLGSGVLLAFPIPLWAYLKPGASEYELIKTWQGLYMIYMLPLALAGFLGVVHNIRKRDEFVSERVFIALYAVGMLAAVAATSLETRHIGQFLPAFILLAAMPDMRQNKERRRVRSMRFTWIAILGVVHLAWAGFRYL